MLNILNLKLIFFQPPIWLEQVLQRLDHLVAAFSPKIKLFNFENGINISVNTHSDKLQLVGNINGETVKFPNVPLWLNENIDAKFDTIAQYEVDAGFVRKFLKNWCPFSKLNYWLYIKKKLSNPDFFAGTCNLIDNQLSTFSGTLVNVSLSENHECPTVLFADCTATSKFALFITRTRSTGTFTLKLHVGDMFVTYTPRADGKDILLINGKEEIEIVSEVRAAPDNDDFRYNIMIIFSFVKPFIFTKYQIWIFSKWKKL